MSTREDMIWIDRAIQVARNGGTTLEIWCEFPPCWEDCREEGLFLANFWRVKFGPKVQPPARTLSALDINDAVITISVWLLLAGFVAYVLFLLSFN